MAKRIGKTTGGNLQCNECGSQEWVLHVRHRVGDDVIVVTTFECANCQEQLETFDGNGMAREAKVGNIEDRF